MAQLRSVLNRFATSHPGQILDITSSDIDAWLRGLNVSPSSRNSMLLYVNILFSFALEQNYLPEGKPIASSQLRKVKVRSWKTCPSLQRKKVTPHTLRHTTAMDLLHRRVENDRN